VPDVVVTVPASSVAISVVSELFAAVVVTVLIASGLIYFQTYSYLA